MEHGANSPIDPWRHGHEGGAERGDRRVLIAGLAPGSAHCTGKPRGSGRDSTQGGLNCLTHALLRCRVFPDHLITRALWPHKAVHTAPHTCARPPAAAGTHLAKKSATIKIRTPRPDARLLTHKSNSFITPVGLLTLYQALLICNITRHWHCANFHVPYKSRRTAGLRPALALTR